MMGMSIFVTATDTDAGKTFITASLVRAFAKTGLKACALKPVCCGRTADHMNPDIKALLEAQNMSVTQTDAINLYDFAAPAAPGQAAAEEDKIIALEKLMQWCHAKTKEHDITLIEGVGGLMVPLAENFLVCDWLAAMPDCVVVLVVRVRLGGINHALLSLRQLQSMGRNPAWVILNDADESGSAMLARHAEAMTPFLPSSTRFLSLPHMARGGYAPPASLMAFVGDMQFRVKASHGEKNAHSDC